jgi:TolA-binding protein
MVQRIFLLVLVLFPCLAFAQRKELVELQRDVALLQDQVKSLQKSVEEKLSHLEALLQQALDTANKANRGVTALDAGLRERMEKSVAAPVAGVNSRLDQMTSEFQGVKESVGDLTSRMSKLQNQMADLGNAIKTLSAPPPPPGGPPAGVSAESLYTNAMRDRSSGNADLAIEQFKDYLRYFPDTDMAPNAQYYIGELLFFKSDWDGALNALDTVLEKYPESQRIPDALYIKGRTLIKADQKLAGANEYRDLIKRFPRHELSSKARSELRSMGLSATPPAKKK